MAIRQEKYTIYTRPYIKSRLGQVQVNIYADKNTDFFTDNPLSTGVGCTHLQIAKKEGEECWVSFYSSNSLEKIRGKYKELIENLGEGYVKVEKNVPIDTIITPKS